MAVPGAQLLFAAQHPPQLTESQTHAPLTQWRPTPHWVDPPQVQAPAIEQPSARTGSHATHAAPAMPQVATARGAHVVPEQQPFGHVVGEQPDPLHTPPSQVDAPQLWHAPPAVPQAFAAVPGSHLFPAQQPVGHDAALQTHAPPTHASPTAQAAIAPQRQTPFAQVSARGPHAVQAPPAVPHCAADDRHWS